MDANQKWKKPYKQVYYGLMVQVVQEFDKLRQIQYMMLGLFEYVYINIKNVVNAFWFIWKYFAAIKRFGTIQ